LFAAVAIAAAGCGSEGDSTPAQEAPPGNTRGIGITAVVSRADVARVVVDAFQDLPANQNAIPLQSSPTAVLATDGLGNFRGQVFLPPGSYWFFATAYVADGQVAGRGRAQATVMNSNSTDSTAISLRILDWAVWLGAPVPDGLPDPGPVIASITYPRSVLLSDLLAGSLPTLAVSALDPPDSAGVSSPLAYAWSASPLPGAPAGSCAGVVLGSPDSPATTFNDTQVETCQITVVVSEENGNYARVTFTIAVLPPPGTGTVTISGSFLQMPLVYSVRLAPAARTEPVCSVSRVGPSSSCPTPFVSNGQDVAVRVSFDLGGISAHTASLTSSCPGDIATVAVPSTASYADFTWRRPTGYSGACVFTATVTNTSVAQNPSDSFPVHLSLLP
jgi:hypothetical protein